MILLQTHHCPYFTGPARTFPDQQELLEFLFPCAALAVPGAQVLDFSALGRELWGDTGKWHRAPGSVCPLQFHPQELLWVATAECWRPRSTKEHSQGQDNFCIPGMLLPMPCLSQALPAVLCSQDTSCAANHWMTLLYYTKTKQFLQLSEQMMYKMKG